MRYEHTPRPLIENHYHIKELIESHEKRTEDRIYHREKEKNRADRDSEIASAQNIVETDFWCNECKEDFKSEAIKEIELDWYDSTTHHAYYRTQCLKGHYCMRMITDKHRDPFWTQSRAVALDKGNHFADLIQPHETGFNMLYKKI